MARRPNKKRNKLIISRKEIVNRNMMRFKPFVNKTYWGRINRTKHEHYRFLTWVADQYTYATFLDLGTRAGASAMCLASNPNNKVISYDVSHESLRNNNFDFSEFPNISFRLFDATRLRPKSFNNADVIFLDIDHTGDSERIVLNNINKSKFKGILIMDDINHHRFPELKKIWDEIERPKWIVSYAHDSGTGIVSYGPGVKLET